MDPLHVVVLLWLGSFGCEPVGRCDEHFMSTGSGTHETQYDDGYARVSKRRESYYGYL